MKNVLILLTAALALSACNGEVTDFVKGAIPPNLNVPTEPVVASPPGPSAIKVSPGQMRASTTNGAAVANVTPTNQLMKSGDISARVGISRNRVSNQ